MLAMIGQGAGRLEAGVDAALGVLGDDQAAPTGGGVHGLLFRLYQEVEIALGAAAMDGDEARSDALTERQDALLAAAGRLPARSTEAVAYKLALWRWDAGDLDGEEVTRAESVALSALSDLSRMAGLDDLAP